MNKAVFIGNLTKEPELRSTPDGTQLCNFTVAVNRNIKGQDTADFVRVTAWRNLAETCGRYLHKGRKVAVTGSVTANAYTGNDGKPVGQLEIKSAENVEFLSPKDDPQDAVEPAQTTDPKTGYMQVDDEELPF